MNEIRVRQATLADTYAITDIHCSNVQNGVFTRRNFDGSYSPASYEELSLYERYMNGGAWMSVETCAVWLAHLLRYEDEIPLVAIENGMVRGEAEVTIGNEPAPYGKHLQITTLCVHREAQRNGLGTALLNYIKQMAQVMHAYQVLVANPPQVDFFQKHGFRPLVVRRELITPTREGHVVYKAVPLPTLDSAVVSGWAMPFGRYHNARHSWIYVLSGFWNCVPELAEPEIHRFEVQLPGQRAILVFEQDRYLHKRAHAYLWTERPLSGLMVTAVKDRAVRLGYEELALFVDDATRPLVETEARASQDVQMVYAWRPS